MSIHETPTRVSASRDCPIIEGRHQIQRISSREADVGGLPIHRAMPTRERRTIGAWCFLDHAGPSILRETCDAKPGMDVKPGMKVGPHPHTCLQTFTWMLEGEVHHRDSLGSDQVIRPGQVNLMTAGYGISHTEVSLDNSPRLHAAQLWIALPHEQRHTQPRFDHYPALPRWHRDGTDLTLLIGEFEGHEAPTLSFSPLVGVDIVGSNSGIVLPLRDDFEYGILVLEGSANLDGELLATDELAYLGMGRQQLELHLNTDDQASGSKPARVLLIGGEPLESNILMWWNFVGHSREEIITAQHDWEAASDRFGSVPGWQGERLEAPPIPWKQG
ncbi:pirin family protein [Halomonas cupida]|uniref:pirin family protein n=1 Tax=Halomonas cupida TaxID=44933 RepID=UPI003A93ED4C